MTLPADLQSIWGSPKQVAVEHNEKPETIFGKEKKKKKKDTEINEKATKFPWGFSHISLKWH